LLVVFLRMAIITGIRWNLSVVLICISFMARGGEHFFIFVRNALFIFYSYVHTMLGSFLPVSPTSSHTSLCPLPLPPPT
jgi:hypothetical protein